MIPKLIHQTWKTAQIPGNLAAYEESWQRHNPSWRRILWTDRMLVDFVAEHYPDLLELYCSYPTPVCRADAARYMLLHTFGGLYADIDVECLAPLTPLIDEERAVLCHEPPNLWPETAPYRSHPFILFNGVMASPAGHPFWRHVLDRLPETRHGTSVIDMTGPCFLTGVYLGLDDTKDIAVHSCHLFTPTDREQTEAPPYGDDPAPDPLTRHHWEGSWVWKAGRKKWLRRALTSGYHRLRYHLQKGPVLDLDDVKRRIGPDVLKRLAPQGDRVAMLVPVRDAATHLDPFIEAISGLDLPAEKIKLVFCEGDSTDDTREKLRAMAPGLRQRFRDVVLLDKEVGTRFAHDHRSDKKLQRARRAGLAVVRNHLIDHGLDETDDWALWIDVDVWRFPSDIFARLRSADARIVVPNCTKVAGGPTFDMNSFVSDWRYPDHIYYRHIYGGLFQPPKGANQLYLADLRHSERVELDGVGGTTLLVDASLHRAGLRFPEIPYKDLIETEGFGLLARDLGVRAVGLPRVEVLHVPY